MTQNDHPTTSRLTQRQLQVFNFIRSYNAENGYPPSLADIARALKVFPNSIVSQIKALQSLKLITVTPFVARGIALVDQRTGGEQQRDALLKELELIADIAEGSTTANSLQNIAKIARMAIAKAKGGAV